MMKSFATFVLCSFLFCRPVDSSVFRFDQSQSHPQPQERYDNERIHYDKQTSDKLTHGYSHNKVEDQSSCGYKACNPGKPDMLNVHFVSHTHDDVGWLKTVDQYYYGAHNEIQHAGVQYILDTVIDQLLKDPSKRFIYVEIAFFYRWWLEQDDSMRHRVKGLVNEGRLEFILGGWCMNDEAATHYNAIIDQHTVGFRFLQRNFGECGRPKIGWQIDPFGHSREQASIFAQFGFDGLFFGRLDYQDKNQRMKDKTMEHMWEGSANLGKAGFLLTGVNYNGYGPPPGFCFDRGCADPPMMDDPRMEDYNVDEKVDLLLKAAKDQAKHYSTNHIMFTMGSDFQFENAGENFKNLDKLMKYVNQRSSATGVNVFYSTPSCYLYALNKANKTYTTKTDDFFPYASRAHTFWTGYFTSRPAIKLYVRNTNNFLQVCKQLDVLSQLGPEYGSALKLEVLRQAMGVAQHHDAVSGTEKQAVADDYSKRLARGVAECQDVVNYAYQKLLPLKDGLSGQPKQEFCNLLNSSYCTPTETYKKFTMVVYNPIARNVNHWVRIPVSSICFNIVDSEGHDVIAQVLPLGASTLNLPDHKGSIATAELIFNVSLPPLGFNTYFFAGCNAEDKQNGLQTTRDSTASTVYKQDIILKNEHLSLTFSGKTGLLSYMSTGPTTIPVKQSLQYYKGFLGDNKKAAKDSTQQSSGAYIFRPNGTEPIPIQGQGHDGPVKTTLVQGTNVQEVHQVYSDWASQVYRVYKDDPFVEVEWTVGPIPFQDGIGREVISRYETPLQSNGEFYTDSNGREILKRVRDYRPTWTLNQTEKIAGNYYPVNSRIYIRGSGLQFTVLTDRSQGGSSLMDGQIELMVHRRLLQDDVFGVGQALNESGITGKGLVVRGKHYLLLKDIETSERLVSDKAEKLYMAPYLSFTPLNTDVQTYKQKYNVKWSAVSRALPDNVHLLTLEEWEANSFLLRLEHFYEAKGGTELSKSATVQLKNLFKPFTIKSVEELTLGGNQKLSEGQRLEWNVQGQGRTNGKMSTFVTPVDPNTLEVKLEPMQLRTFQVFF